MIIITFSFSNLTFKKIIYELFEVMSTYKKKIPDEIEIFQNDLPLYLTLFFYFYSLPPETYFN